MLRVRVLLCVLTLASTPLRSAASDHILLARLAPTQADLFISNADGTAEHPLTQPGSLDYNPAWSPEGDWIVFTSERGGSADIYRVHPDGTGLERLTDNPAFDDQAAFSPDGKPDRLRLHPRRRPRKSLDSRRRHPQSHAPDHRHTAATSAPPGLPTAHGSPSPPTATATFPPAKGRWERLHLVDIYLIHPDGTGLKRISQHGDFCGSPKWTARQQERRRLLHVRAGYLGLSRRRIETATTKLFRSTSPPAHRPPSPRAPASSSLPRFYPPAKSPIFAATKPRPGVFYASGKPGPAGSRSALSLLVARWSSSRLQPLHLQAPREPGQGSGAGIPTSTSTAPHGCLPTIQRTSASRSPNQPRRRSSSLFIVEEGKPAHSIPTAKSSCSPRSGLPTASRSSSGVGAFTAFLDFAAGGKKPVDPVNGGAQVAIINADGTGFHLITSGPNNNAFASFSPDGKHIVYRTAGPDGEGLRIMNLDDHAITTLTNVYDNFPVWSPHGNLIAFIRRIGGNFEVFTIHPDGTGLKQFTNTRGNEAHLAWSPDGERLLFSSTRMGFKDEALYTGAPQPYGEIFVMRYDGTQVEQLTDNQWEEGGPAWQLDKTALAAAPARSK